MNQSVLLSSLVQQMMTGNPNWWNINNIPSSSSSLPLTTWNDNQDLPESWCQLLLGGFVGEEERSNLSHFQSKKEENWEEEQVLYPYLSVPVVDVKQGVSQSGNSYRHVNEEFQEARPTWCQVMPALSPRSFLTSYTTNMLDFSNKAERKHERSDHSSECNGIATGGAFKKARVQQSSTQSTFKVRKEKLGDRITALHQLVSPFGKTDTASVLLEAIGYIRFLQSQIEALSSPYLGNVSGNTRQQHSVQGDRNCIFPEDPGQDPGDELKKDLRSRGLCLVPVSCTLQVGSDNGADYWAPSLGAGFQ